MFYINVFFGIVRVINWIVVISDSIILLFIVLLFWFCCFVVKGMCIYFLYKFYR